ncbi:urea transporter 1-like [Asterias rubens]|uniref:urea transporter 1-like n=1 Tax=Asterias rubens TaxID=7604 RepID=UPI001455CE81|nr:urea transporter 1-like [Asterias rubens]XP_033639661.1 urea transporter 1-like [Asterias rubens]XP_033639662.1 urea transporter 1-like [Asterias rubens]
MATELGHGETTEAKTTMARLVGFTAYFTGTVEPLDRWVATKPCPVRFLNACCRGFGQPIFLNNPISGLIIMVALFVQNPWQALCGILGLVVAQLTAMAMRQPRGGVDSGGVAFQGLLTGLVIPALTGLLDWQALLLLPVALFAIFSVFLSSALGNLLGQWGIPAFNLPFNVATFLFVAASGPTHPYFRPAPAGPQVGMMTVVPNATDQPINWLMVLSTIPVGIGQCYGCDKLATGCLMALAMLICSPTVFLHGVIGSILGTLTGLAMAAPHADIYAGLWSYNSVLTCASVGGFFFVLTWQSHLVALFSAIFAAVVKGALSAVLKPAGLPDIAFPFCIAAGLFLLVTSESKLLMRVPMDKITWPEDHRRKFKPGGVADVPDGEALEVT